MDIFCEQLVKKEKTIMDTIKSIGLIFAAIIVSFLILFGFSFVPAFYSVGLLLIVGAFWGAIYLIIRQNIEYEYIVTNSILDIDKIMAKKSRKRLLSVDFKEITYCKPFEKESLVGVKVMDFTPNGIEDGVYIVEFFKNAERTLLLFKPNVKVLTNLKKASPRLVTLRPEDVKE